MSEARTPAFVLRLGRLPYAAWIGLGALALVAWRQGLAFALSEGGAGTVEHILFDAADNPPWLLAIVAVALLISRARDVRAAIGAPGSPLRAALLLAPGLALLGWARFVDAADLAMLGTLFMALGAAYAAAGGAFLRIVALPLLLLAFAVPVPGVLVNAVIYPLQMATASYAHELVTWLGFTAVRSADIIRTASHTFL
ncbi:MAG TPA: archaeosortase/exosortase family protein, partial [Myxococcota bacterium]|nr:archaeosortase/exosortase family protein [Myxococcota bacterium]